MDGLASLMRAFGELDKELRNDIAMELEEAGEPARKQAEANVLREISGLRQTPFYSRFRTAASRKDGSAYIFPKWSGTKNRARNRPNLARQQQPELEKAVEQRYSDIEKEVEKFLDRLVDDFDRGR